MEIASSSEANKPPEPVTGYPVTYAYGAPPPTPTTQPQAVSSRYYQNHPDDYQTRFEWSPLLCRLIIVAIAIVLVMALASFITWLVLNPQYPEFRVASASISQLHINSANHSMTALWHISLRVENPNKKLALLYDILEASVLYREREMDSTPVPAFSQEKRNETHVDFQAGILSKNVGKRVTRGIEEEKGRGEVQFGVGVLGWVRFKAGWWNMGWRHLRVYCDGVAIGVTSNGGTGGNLVGPVSRCQVGS